MPPRNRVKRSEQDRRKHRETVINLPANWKDFRLLGDGSVRILSSRTGRGFVPHKDDEAKVAHQIGAWNEHYRRIMGTHPPTGIAVFEDTRIRDRRGFKIGRKKAQKK